MTTSEVMAKKTINYLHPGNIGDVWASIPAMREAFRVTGKKIVLHLEIDRKAEYYEGATHPTKNSENKYVMLNRQVVEMMIPLLKAQPFIEDALVWDEETTPYDQIVIDLGDIRTTEVGMPAFSINRWYFYVFPDLACDLSDIWLTVPRGTKDFATDKILVTRSERYLNDRIDYSFLKPYEDDLVFCGTMREYNKFAMMYDLNIKKLTISNFLELAQAVDQCKFHISNQTQAFQLSEGLKKPRIVELCKLAPNVIPMGANGYDFFSQKGLEYFFHKLNGTLDGFVEKEKERHNTSLKEKAAP